MNKLERIILPLFGLTLIQSRKKLGIPLSVVPVAAKGAFAIPEDLDAKIKPTIGKIQAKDGTTLSYARYASKQPKGCLLFFHGGGAHGQAGYTLMAEQLSSYHNIATYLFDIRGHGCSGGPRGHASSTFLPWEDISCSIHFLRAQYESTPIYLGGHSSGAGLVLNYSAWKHRLSVDAYVMVAPELGFRFPAQHKTFSDTLMSRRTTPFTEVNVKAFIANSIFGTSGDSMAVKFNYSPKMIAEGFLPGYTVNMSRAVTPDDPMEYLRSLHTPTCILLGEEDELIDPKKFIALAEQIDNPNLTIHQIPGGAHLSILKMVDNEIASFLSKPIKQPGSPTKLPSKL